MHKVVEINPSCSCGREMHYYGHKNAGTRDGRRRTAFVWYCAHCDAAESPRLDVAQPAPRKVMPFAEALAAAMKEASRRGHNMFVTKLRIGAYHVESEWNGRCVATVYPNGTVEEADELADTHQDRKDRGSPRRPVAQLHEVLMRKNTKCPRCGCERPRHAKVSKQSCPECGYDNCR